MNRAGFGVFRALFCSLLMLALFATGYSLKVLTAPVLAASDPPATNTESSHTNLKGVSSETSVTISKTAAEESLKTSGRQTSEPRVQPGRSVSDISSVLNAGSEFLEFHATAYCLKGRTASGVNTRPGVVAADPRVLPLGTVVQIKAGPYTGIYTVLDTGGRIKGRTIDVYLPNYREAIKFGRQRIKVRVLSRGRLGAPRTRRTVAESR